MESSADAVSVAQRLAQQVQRDEATIRQSGRFRGSALQVHQALARNPVWTLKEIARHTGLSFPAASNGMKSLAELNIVNEYTEKRHNRIFVYAQYLSILSGEDSEHNEKYRTTIEPANR